MIAHFGQSLQLCACCLTLGATVDFHQKHAPTALCPSAGGIVSLTLHRHNTKYHSQDSVRPSNSRLHHLAFQEQYLACWNLFNLLDKIEIDASTESPPDLTAHAHKNARSRSLPAQKSVESLRDSSSRKSIWHVLKLTDRELWLSQESGDLQSSAGNGAVTLSGLPRTKIGSFQRPALTFSSKLGMGIVRSKATCLCMDPKSQPSASCTILRIVPVAFRLSKTLKRFKEGLCCRNLLTFCIDAQHQSAKIDASLFSFLPWSQAQCDWYQLINSRYMYLLHVIVCNWLLTQFSIT